MPFRKTTVMAVGVGALLAIAVAIIDNVRVTRLAWSIHSCPDPRCPRMAQLVQSEPLHVLVAFALGFVVVFVWSLRGHTLNHD